MKDTQHYKTRAVKSIAKNISRVRYFKHKLANFGPPLNGAANERMFRENASLVFDFRGNDFRKVRDGGREGKLRSDQGQRALPPTIRASLVFPRPKVGRSPGVKPTDHIVMSDGRLAGLDGSPLPIEICGVLGR
jgi:hypothetical protein